MVTGEGLYCNPQRRLAENLAMPTKSGHKFLRRLGRLPQCLEKRFLVRAGQHEALVFVEHAPSSLIGEIACPKPRDSHGASDQPLGGWRQPKLEPFGFMFSTFESSSRVS